jgi:hypothetical protein
MLRYPGLSPYRCPRLGSFGLPPHFIRARGGKFVFDTSPPCALRSRARAMRPRPLRCTLPASAVHINGCGSFPLLLRPSFFPRQRPMPGLQKPNPQRAVPHSPSPSPLNLSLPRRPWRRVSDEAQSCHRRPETTRSEFSTGRTRGRPQILRTTAPTQLKRRHPDAPPA